MDSVALLHCQDDLDMLLSNGVELIGGVTSMKFPFIIKPNINIRARIGIPSAHIDP
jgi:hypothetical protein